jgi:hypothetical protein
MGCAALAIGIELLERIPLKTAFYAGALQLDWRVVVDRAFRGSF